MAGKGGKRKGAGRPSKAKEARMRDKVSPYIPEAIESVVDIMRTAEKDSDKLAASKLLIEYYAGKPQQMIDHTTDGQVIKLPPLNFVES